jgi:hypothetical protein
VTKNLSVLIASFLFIAIECDSAEITVVLEVKGKTTNANAKGHLALVFAKLIESDELLDFTLVEKTETKGSVIFNWFLEGVKRGKYKVIVRDEPNLIGEYIFAQKEIKINGDDDKLRCNFTLNENSVWVRPMVNGRGLEQVGLKNFDNELFILLINKNQQELEYCQIQKIPVRWNSVRSEFGARFYFLENTDYQCRLVRGNVGLFPLNDELKKTFQFPRPLPDVFELDFEQK